MSTSQAAEHWICPHCGAAIPADANSCWLCRYSIPPIRAQAATAPVIKASLASDSAVQQRTFQFTLSSMMLIFVLTAIVMSVCSMQPVLGIGLAVLVLPALVITVVIAMRRGAHGEPLTLPAKIAVFAAVVGASLITVVAACIGFFVTCLAGLPGASANNITTIIGLSSAGALLAAGVTVYLIVQHFRRPV
jgi:hypothetical protein